MTNEKMRACAELCWECRHRCQTELFTYCLQQGGDHVAPEHVRLMSDCIDICQTAADFMTRQSDYHDVTCEACADICAACAQSCRDIGMEECAEICAACAGSCRDMSQAARRHAA